MKSDSDLQHEIQNRLENDPEVNVEFLGVQVCKGAVTLSLASALEKHARRHAPRTLNPVDLFDG